MRLKQILKRKTGGHSVRVKMINVKEKKTTSMTAGNGNFPAAFTNNVSGLPVPNLENELEAERKDGCGRSRRSWP